MLHHRPKLSTRLRPRLVIPIRLDDQCLDVVVRILTEAADTLIMSNNRWDMKNLRKYMAKSLPLALQQDVLQRAVESLTGVQSVLNLLHLFMPIRVLKHKINLLGPSRTRFGCYLRGVLRWGQCTDDNFNLTLPQLDQLNSILMPTDPSELYEFCASMSSNSLTLSRITTFLHKGRYLTRVTLLNGADDHCMRILGTCCPRLVYLDVSHSVEITNASLQSLLLKDPARRRRGGIHDASDKNPCAQTLTNIILLDTSVTWDGCDYPCTLLGSAYFYCSLPLTKILKVNLPTGTTETGVRLERRTQCFLTPPRLTDNVKTAISDFVHACIGPNYLRRPVVDIYIPSEEEKCKGRQTMLFVRRRHCFQLYVHIKMDETTVTTLILPFYDLSWNLHTIVLSMDILGSTFPGLRLLRGRIQGVWNRVDKPFLPNLTSACIWTLNSATGLSFLQHATAVTHFELNDTNVLPVTDVFMIELTDSSLEACFSSNTKLATVIQEITIRPSVLTIRALHVLIRSCPNLKIIGDLQCWEVNTDQLLDFNRYLDSIGSQCVLSILNSPPTTNASFEWI